MRRPALAGLVTCLAAPVAAQASCPGPADLATGIVVTDSTSGDTLYQEVFRASDPAVVSVEGYDDGRLIYSGLLAQGFYDLTSVDFEDGVLAYATTWLHDMPVDDFIRPDAQVTGMLPYRESREDGSEHEGTLMFEAGPLTDYAIGACHYPAVEIRAADMDASGAVETLDRYVYLTSLGISLYLGWTDSDNNREEYDYEAIAPLKEALPLGK